MQPVRFTGTWSIDRKSSREAFRQLDAATRKAVSIGDPELAGLLPKADVDKQTDEYLTKPTESIAPFARRIAEELDDEVHIRFTAVHVHQEDWGRDFIGDDVYISRTDMPQAEPVRVPRHMSQSYGDFWDTVLSEAKKLNRQMADA
jgi:hypothetical protein